MKKHGSTVILILVLLAGFSLLLYPSISNYWNSLHQTAAISAYTDTVAELDREAYSALWQQAQEYNLSLNERYSPYLLSDDLKNIYPTVLNLSGDGIMGYIEIPAIDVEMPIYHGTDPEVLQVAAGHVEWSDLPIGGSGTHTILSGHRGLPGAKLFTDLDRLEPGDVFRLRILNETLSYEVDRVLTVEPEDVDSLAPVDGEDLCTLVTCTPYGVNTHRLLVRAHRITVFSEGASVHIAAEASQVRPELVACCIAVPLLVLVLILDMLFSAPKRPKKKGAQR